MLSSKPTPTSFSDLLKTCRRSASKLELRDGYLPNDPAYVAWMDGRPEETYARYAPWGADVRSAVAQGIDMRRVRVVSEPVSDYIRFEHAVTARVNLEGGERVRWVARTEVWDLQLPATDLWLVDDEAVLFYFFSGDGESAGSLFTDDPEVVARCSEVFTALWERGTDHEDYQP